MQQYFHIPAGAYLLSHSVGCLPKTAETVLHLDYLTPWAKTGGDAWPKWLSIIDDFCAHLGQLFNIEPEDICPQSNLSSALTKYLTAVDIKPNKNKVLMHHSAFPSMGFVAKALESYGYQLELIGSEYCSTSLQGWKTGLGDDVAAVVITHVHSNTGCVSPVEEIARLANSYNAKVIVDVAQSAGVIPIDLSAWQVDMVMGSCVKWLCSGPGAGFMWLNPAKVNQLKPCDVGWFSHQNPFEFDIEHFEFAQGAKRFWGGTPNIAPYAIAKVAIKTINTIGVDLIYQHSKHLQQIVLEAVKPYLLESIDLNRVGGTLCLSFAKQDVDRLQVLFERHQIFFDRRKNTLRLSFHIYNDESHAHLVGDLITANLTKIG